MKKKVPPKSILDLSLVIPKTILKAIKRKGKFFLSTLRARKSDNLRERYQERKLRMDIKYKAKKIKSDNFTRSNRGKLDIAVAILGKVMI